MKKNLFQYLLIAVLIFSIRSQSQTQDTIVVAFWNQENLFDTIDDPQKKDEEFLPSGKKKWTNERLERKLFNHSRVIRAMNYNSGPDILGFCEVEHKSLIDSLINNYLPDLNFSVAYKESPDNRGIDNGLIYRKNKFSLLSITADTVKLLDGYPTRLILNVNLLTINGQDTLHIFVNHWPSRRGGAKKSEINRITAAKTLRSKVNALFEKNIKSKIIIIGDFNDEPVDDSILKYLKAFPVTYNEGANEDFEVSGGNLFNTAYDKFAEGEGSYKYGDNWNMLDQIIISQELLTGDQINYIKNSFIVFKPEFIITKSGKYAGTPFPTYGGNRYLGGYSDHFPVFVKFQIH